MTKIFIAGATGVIGRFLVPLLVEAGHEVSAMTRSASGSTWLQSIGVRPMMVDVFDRDGVIAALGEVRPNVVYHQLTDLSKLDFAANTRIRIEGTPNLVDGALAVGVRRIIAQSISFAYVPGDSPAHEDEPLRPFAGTPELEQSVAHLPEAVILRYGTLYGPGTFYARDGMVADQVRRGERVANENVTSFLHVEDAAHAALFGLNWPVGPVNIVDDEPAPGTEWLPLFASLIGAPPPPIQPGKDRNERGASNVKARQQLAWQPRYPTWHEGFKSALAQSIRY